MYAFEARLPVDHVLAAVRMLRLGSVDVPELLKLIGASVGEVGALMARGPIFSLDARPEGFVDLVDENENVEQAISYLEEFDVAVAADPNFDPTPWIPLILMVLEWLMNRRRG